MIIGDSRQFQGIPGNSGGFQGFLGILENSSGFSGFQGNEGDSRVYIDI